MAKKVAKEAPATEATGIVTIKDLCQKYKIEAYDLRALLRANGFSAPKIDVPAGTFGPRAKYTWEAGSEDLVKIEKLIQSTLDEDEADEKPAKPAKKAAKVEAPVEDDEDDEEDADDADEEVPTPKKAKKAKK